MNPWARLSCTAPTALLRACALAVALSACSGGGDENFFRRLGDLALRSVAGGKEVAPRELTRAELNQIPYATIAVSSDGGPRAYLVPQANNGGYLDYRDESGNSVRVLGGAVAGLQTAGRDLDAVLFEPADPIARPRPLAQWPGQVWRQYQYTQHQLGPYVISLRCVFEPEAQETIEIVELAFTLIRVRETCANARRSVTNTYWVDPRTGFIWKSQQWLGPQIGQISVEVIRPYAG